MAFKGRSNRSTESACRDCPLAAQGWCDHLLRFRWRFLATPMCAQWRVHVAQIHTHTQSTPAHTFTHSHSGLSSVHCAHAVRQTFSQLLNQCEIVLIQKGHSTHSLQQLEPATPSGSASDCDSDSDSDSDSTELMPWCPGALVSC